MRTIPDAPARRAPARPAPDISTRAQATYVNGPTKRMLVTLDALMAGASDDYVDGLHDAVGVVLARGGRLTGMDLEPFLASLEGHSHPYITGAADCFMMLSQLCRELREARTAGGAQ